MQFFFVCIYREKNMEKQIKKIVEEICREDESFRGKEKELFPVVKKFVELRPISNFDNEVKAEIKKLFYKKTEEVRKTKETHNIWFFMEHFFGLKYAIFGAFAVVLVIAGISYLGAIHGGRVTLENFSSSEYIALGENAFGSLSESGGETVPNSKTALRSQSFDAAPKAMTDTAMVEESDSEMMAVSPPVGFGGGGGVSAISAPEMYSAYFEYVYEGQNFSLPSPQMEIFRKKKPDSQDRKNFLLALQSSGFNFINISGFQNAELQSFSISENREFGYSLNVDFGGPFISIYKNWAEWPTETASPVGDIDEKQIISIADSFLGKFGISKEGYGSPIISPSWQKNFERIEGKEMMTSQVPVLYPTVINGLYVYDEGGNISGMTVSVDATVMKVSDMWGFTLPRYESSLYNVETDVRKIISIAEKRNMIPMFVSLEEKGTARKIVLGTPEFGYATVSRVSQDGRVPEEFIVPALVFPVVSAPNEYYLGQSIVLPVIKDILSDY